MSGNNCTTVRQPCSVYQISHGVPHCHKLGFEWPKDKGNPPFCPCPSPGQVTNVRPPCPPPRCPPPCCPPPCPPQPSRPPACCPPPPCCPQTCCTSPCCSGPKPVCTVKPGGVSEEMCRTVKNCPGDPCQTICDDHLHSLYQKDYCRPWPCCPCLYRGPGLCGTAPARRDPVSVRLPLGATCGLPRKYHGKCTGGTGAHGGAGGGPIKRPCKKHGIMGPPNKRCTWSTGLTEYQASISRLGRRILCPPCKPRKCLRPVPCYDCSCQDGKIHKIYGNI